MTSYSERSTDRSDPIPHHPDIPAFDVVDGELVPRAPWESDEEAEA